MPPNGKRADLFYSNCSLSPRNVRLKREESSPIQSFTRKCRLLDKAVHVNAVTAGGRQDVEAGVIFGP